MKPNLAVQLQQMIYSKKHPPDKVVFELHPLTKQVRSIPDNFNGVDVITNKYFPLDRIDLKSKV